MIPSTTPPWVRRASALGGQRAKPRLAPLLLLLVLLGAPAAAQDPPDADAGIATSRGEEKAPDTGSASAESVAEQAVEAPEQAAKAPEEAAKAPEEADPSAGKAQLELDAAQLEDALDSAAPAADDDMEEILVTGIRREDLLQDVPISITSFNAAEIKSLRIQNIADLAEYTPNLEINTAFAASNPTLFIRGIGLKDYNANAAGAVGVYQDGINIDFPAIQLGQIFDTRSIEVMKGPQGSLNGRNASAGAIMINSVMPDGEFGFNSSFTYGNYNTIEAEAGMTIPIIEDMLSARVAFTANFRDGVTKNNCAKWDPTEHGFRELTEQTTRDLYHGLQPFGERVKILVGKELVEIPGAPDFINQANERTELRYVYLNSDLSIVTNEDGATDDSLGRVFEDVTLTNDFTLPDGSVLPAGSVIPKDTVVGLQGKVFEFSPSQVDRVCIVDAPGTFLTYEGADAFRSTTGTPFPAFGGSVLEPVLEGDEPFPGTLNEFFGKESVQTLEDFQGLKRYINNVDNWAGRGILRLQPTEGMDWILNFHGGQNRSDSAHLQSIGAKSEDQFIVEATDGDWSEKQAAEITGDEDLIEVPGLSKLVVPAPIDPETGLVLPPPPGGQTGDDPFIGWYNQDGQEFIDSWGGSLRGFWDLGPLALSSLSGYETYDRLIEDEGDANPGSVFPANYEDSGWQVSQEFRAEGEGERYSWRGGLFFMYDELDSFNLFPDTFNYRLEQTFDQALWSLAPYGGGRYQLLDDLSVEAGLRYNVEHKEFTLESVAFGTNCVQEQCGENAEIPEDTDDATWTALTGDFTLSYAPFDRFLAAGEAARIDSLHLYTRYARGFKGGHFNASLSVGDVSGGSVVTQEIEPVEPEHIHSVEIGFKSRWFEDRLVLNVAGFRYWYKDMQVFDTTNEAGGLPLPKLHNADANVLGMELELQARPLPGLFVQAGFGLLDSTFGDFTVEKSVREGGAGGGSFVERTFDYKGNSTIAAPRYNVNAIVQYDIPLFGWGYLVPQYDFSWRSKVYLDPQQLDLISQPAYWLHNARLAYRTEDGRIEVAAWVRNFLDEQYRVDVFDITRSSTTILESWGDPRTFGMTLSFNW